MRTSTNTLFLHDGKTAETMTTIRPRTIFITGTDTGVGKTLLTGLLLHHLRQNRCHALAMKPFCSGGTADVKLLHALQNGELKNEEINPFFFPEPIAPLLSARRRRRSIPLREVLKRIQFVQAKFQRPKTSGCLLIEGSGGLMVPLGENYTVADLIEKLKCEVIITSRNLLGTINHTLLTARALQDAGQQRLKVVLMDGAGQDASSLSNTRILTELLAPVPVISIPFLGPNSAGIEAVKKNQKRIKKTLARILA